MTGACGPYNLGGSVTKGLVRAVTSGATTTIPFDWAQSQVNTSLDTASTLMITTLIRYLRLEHSIRTEIP